VLEQAETAPWRSVGCPVLGIARFWSGAAPDADGTLEQAIDRARPAGNHLAVVHALGGLAAIHAEQGALEKADQLAWTATHLADEHGPAEHWATTLTRVAAGKALAQQGRLDEAEAVIGRAVEVSRRGVAQVESAYSLLALAGLRQTQGASDQAKQLLREARRAVEACPDPGILADLLAMTERRLRLMPVRRTAPATDPEALTDRERAVLRLLPSRLSQREIAAALYVSPSTGKTHCETDAAVLGDR
jgi:ATP/maltotriose-dependent transcriptional regulator MalT